MHYDPKHPLLQRKDRAFQRLFNVESEFMAAQGYSDNAQKARLRGLLVTIIDKLSKCREFDAFVPYLAVNYLDRFLSRNQHIPPVERTQDKNIKLFATCCLMLAWKTRMMEYRIQSELACRMRSVTAICFMEYFYPFFKLRQPQPIEGFSRRDISKTLITIQGDIKFTKFKPSIIAASAVLIASFKAFPSQFLLRAEAILRCQYIDEGALFQCMEAMGFEILEEVRVIKRAIKLEEEKKIEEAIKTGNLKDADEKMKRHMEQKRIEQEMKMEEARRIEKAKDNNEQLIPYKGEREIKKEKKMEEAKRMEEVKGTEEEMRKEIAKMIEKVKQEKAKKIEEAKKTEEGVDIKDKGKRDEGVEAKKHEGTMTGIKIGVGKKTEEAKKIEEGVDIKDKGKRIVDEGIEAKKPKTDPTKAEAKTRPRRQGGKKVPGLGTIQEEDDDYDYESSLEEEEDVVMDFELNWPVAELEGDLNVPDPRPEQRAAAAPQPRATTTASPNQPKRCSIL